MLSSSAATASTSARTCLSTSALGDTFRLSTSSLMPSTWSCSSSIRVSTLDERESSFALPASMYARAPPTCWLEQARNWMKPLPTALCRRFANDH